MLSPTFNKPFEFKFEGLSKLKKMRIKINPLWFAIRIPMVLIALPAAYGVSRFAGEYLPSPWREIAGGAFESAYIGAIALADQQVDTKDRATTILWYLVNVVAVLASILSNLLFFTGGTYAATTPETLTHAIPLPLLGFFYGLMMHRYSTKQAAKSRKELEEFPHRCECGRGFKTPKQLNGHKAQCPLRIKQP